MHAPQTSAGEGGAVVLIDGVCNVCNAVVSFVIRHDPLPARFRFAALQSESGQQLLRRYGLAADEGDTFVLIEGGRAYVRSAAALRLLGRLGFPWSLLTVLVVVPRPVRDAAYAWFARHRYRWFGRRETCIVPSPEVRSRFLP